jgi:hypothetical protein
VRRSIGSIDSRAPAAAAAAVFFSIARFMRRRKKTHAKTNQSRVKVDGNLPHTATRRGTRRRRRRGGGGLRVWTRMHAS